MTTILSRVTAWGWFWLAYVHVGFAVELYWVFVNSANTMSAQIWGMEQLDVAHPLDLAEWTSLHWLISVTLWIFFLWLSLHFPFGYLR